MPADGDYRFCFDNTFSSFNKKTVFFEIIIETEDGSQDSEDWGNDIFEGLSPEEYYDMKVCSRCVLLCTIIATVFVYINNKHTLSSY